MARPSDLRPWGLALVALCLLAAGGGLTGGAPDRPPEGAPEPAVAVLSAAADVAVLPARLVDDVRSAASAGPSRVVVLGAVLASLLGLPALVRGGAPPAGRGRRALRTRRHAIALRAPPLAFAA
ncbi:MAG TPA: hypothetical protein VHF27_01855 [Acidimicrobiales bacterium]|nr:hypothetical protein [Acidimicrobiales bacterium]